ncbi:hypothetical protein EUGRSUZ_E03970 [Eucalyptus grandis]|uniref:Uncharacterized protein n=2 Tax=Eucalyptus grandis TaxID=71139 RepID=A0ACC3L1F6_EUCGR|nr:hypothetical protein EUGRSUZ_E03970 [Eucalyptus grandis]
MALVAGRITLTVFLSRPETYHLILFPLEICFLHGTSGVRLSDLTPRTRRHLDVTGASVRDVSPRYFFGPDT